VRYFLKPVEQGNIMLALILSMVDNRTLASVDPERVSGVPPQDSTYLHSRILQLLFELSCKQ